MNTEEIAGFLSELLGPPGSLFRLEKKTAGEVLPAGSLTLVSIQAHAQYGAITVTAAEYPIPVEARRSIHLNAVERIEIYSTHDYCQVQMQSSRNNFWIFRPLKRASETSQVPGQVHG